MLFILIGWVYSNSSDNLINPCKDSLFIYLKTIDVEDMTKQQLVYFITKYSDCSIFNNNMILIDSLRQNNNESIKKIIYKESISYMPLLWFLILHNNISH